MLLRALKVSSWRCIVDEVEIGPFSEGINILHAPNATGKSTLFEAMRMGLLDNHASRGARFSAIRPWGRLLSPRVTVDFAHGAADYRISKVFLENGSSSLLRKEGERYVPLAEGPEADRILREFFSAASPGRGGSRQDWGLLQLLWIPQGELPMDSLGTGLISMVRAAVSDQLVDGEAAAFERRLSGRYGFFFTEGGRYKRVSTGKSTQIPFLEEELLRKKEELAKCREDYEEYNRISELVKDLAWRKEEKEKACASIAGRKRELEAKAAAYVGLVREKQVRGEAERGRKAEYAAARDRIEGVENCVRDRGSMEEKMEEIEKNLPEARKCRDGLERCLLEIQGEERDLEGERLKLGKLLEEKGDAEKFLSLSEAMERLREGLHERRRLEGNLSALLESRKAMSAPSGEELRRIRSAWARHQKDQSLARSFPVTLAISSLSEQLVLDTRNPSGNRRSLRQGETLCLRDSPEISIELPSLARIRVFASPEDPEKIERAADESRVRYLELSAPFGTADMEELDRRSEKLVSLEREIARTEGELASSGGGRSSAELSEGILALEREMNALRTLRPGLTGDALLVASKEREIRELDSGLQQRIKEHRGKMEAARGNADQARMAVELLERDLANAGLRRDDAVRRLRELEKDGISLPDRRKRMETTLMEWEAAGTLLREIEKKLEAFPENPVESLERIQGEEALALEGLKELESSLLIQQGRLEALAHGSPYSAMVRREEEVEELEARIRREKRDAEAVRLLREIFIQCRDELKSAMAEPVQERASALLARIAGKRRGNVFFDQALKPGAFRPEELESDVAIGELSGGEEEQVHFASRLALAEVLAARERQLVVMDDIFMATDEDRLRAILQILGEMDRLQILILTCHPGRFLPLGSRARWFDLEKAVAQS